MYNVRAFVELLPISPIRESPTKVEFKELSSEEEKENAKRKEKYHYLHPRATPRLTILLSPHHFLHVHSFLLIHHPSSDLTISPRNFLHVQSVSSSPTTNGSSAWDHLTRNLLRN